MIRFHKAILIVHGFSGGIYDNEFLMNYLEYDAKFDVYAKTLPGHDQDRFKDCKYNEWVEFVDDEIATLVEQGYKTIYVVGHSMGGLLASIAATRHKEVKKLVLVNAAFDYINLQQNKKDFFETKDFDKYKGLFDKILRTSPGFVIEFTKLVKKYQNVAKNITCDVLILQSTEDEIIPKETGTFIYNSVASGRKWLTFILRSSHVVLKGERKEEVSEYIRAYLRGGFKWKRIMTKEL